ncbi:variable large family protein (plasmid) [Borrelia coriaceae]|uniref:Variable large protein n=1 Tax=Borrelia coriaceae ATCC 43381 TaxID=1408429 RepID=W5SWN9_9SPIR|nr:variable large family protein [Borrelia coriaceae]AHH11335.1 Variable outer membrane protein [Borrelia coriaceae ATCC 43381]UPA17356.1 variable large family protein [Borrelia coriaceae]
MKINIKNIRVKSICATLFISLFLSCNNGIEELEKRNTFLSSLANLGNDFLSVFTSFGDTIGGVLGFNTNTKKSDVADYFKKIQTTLERTKTGLNNIVTNMKNDNNPNATATETAVNKLVNETLDKIIEGAKTVSEAVITVAEPLGDVAITSSAVGVGAEESSVKSLSEGIGKIVSVVLGQEGNAEAGDNNKSSGGGARSATAANDGEAGKLFVAESNGAGNSSDNANKVAADAAKAVGAVTGADILKAIVKENGGAAKLAKNSASTISGVTSLQDATLAGGIVLRAMAKSGKFANGKSSHDITTAVKGIAISAVTKALDTLTIAIRNTIDSGLKEVKKAMNINANYTPVTTETKN